MKRRSLNIWIIIVIIIICIPVSYYLKRTINTQRLIDQRSKIKNELPEVLQDNLKEHYDMDINVSIDCKTFNDKNFQDWIEIEIQKPEGFERKANVNKIHA